MESLIAGIEKKEAIVGIIGLGYVGLPIAVEAAASGYQVIGFDVQTDKIKLILDGKNYIKDVVNEELKKCVNNKMLTATDDFSKLSSCDIILICVPTPLDKYFQPNIQYILKASEDILKYRKKPSLVILESTTYPGTTEEVIKPILEKDGSKVGKDLFLAFSPERVDPGNEKYKTKNIPKVIGGCTKKCNEISSKFYSSILTGGIHVVSTPGTAEMEKLLENTFRLVNIGLVNEMAVLADKMNIDIWEVINAAKTKPYGFMPFYPGPGLGGHCIPIDPYYLSWKAKEFHFQTTLIEAAGQTNKEMSEYVVKKIGLILNDNKKTYANSKIIIMGVAYKKDIDDYRESPTLRIHQLLLNLKAEITLIDPFIKEFKGLDGKIYKTTEFKPSLLKNSDLVVIVTDHTSFDQKQILENAKIIYDTRNLIKEKSKKVIKL
jgi:UDP-N-acetyl-D-glucosamine dehydrogenase